MAQNPPPLNVIITASDQTRQAVESAKQGFEGLKVSAGALQGILAGAAAALAGLTVVGKFNSFVEGAAALDDLAEKTGASVERLSALAAVAKTSGVSLEVVEGALTRLAKGLAGADEESKGAGNALAALGLKAEELQKLDTADALKRVADELNKYKDGAGKTALAIDLLGKSGAQALPYLKDLADTQELSARVTAEQAAQAERLQKNLNDLATSTGGAWKEFSAGVLPVVDAFVKALLDAQNSSGGLRDEIRRLSADGSLQRWAENAAIGAAYVVDALKNIVNLFPVLIAEARVFASGFELVFAKIKSSSMQSTERERFLSQIRKEKEKAEIELGDAVGKFLSTTQFSERIKAQFEALRNATGTAPEAKKDLNDYKSNVDRAGAAAKDQLAAIQTYVAQVREQVIGVTDGEFEKMRAKALDVFTKIDFGTLNTGEQKRFREFFAQVLADIDTLEKRALEAQALKSLAQSFEATAKAAQASAAAISGFNDSMGQIAKDLQFEIDLIGKTAEERKRLTLARQIDAAAIRQIAALNAANPETGASPEDITQIYERAEAAKKTVTDLQGTLRSASRDGFTGLQTASAEYFSRITDDAANFSQAFTGIMGALENTFVTFAKTGKFEFKGLVDSIIADIARIVVRQQITAPIANAVNGAIGATGIGGLSGFLANLFGGANRGVSSGLDLLDLPSFAVGTDYVPRDMIAQIHKGERIVPASQNTGGGEVSIVQNINIDSRSDEATIRQAMLVAKEQAKAEIAASLARNGYGAIAGGMA
jgi:hypothetical protein